MEGEPTTTVDNRKFKVLLNGTRDLHQQLEEFKKACDAHDNQHRRRCRRRYYHLGVMARIVNDTTDDELRRLLANGTRTFFFEVATNKQSELQQMVKRTRDAIAECEQEQPLVRTVTGLALEITGDCCRFGRMRNNCSVLLGRGEIITLTTDEAYRYSCFKEIAYVINLRHYLKSLQLQHALALGREVRGRIVKCLKDNVAVQIEEAGLLNSYEYIELPNQCYALKPDYLPQLFLADLATAAQMGANYVVMQNIRCKTFLKVLSLNIRDEQHLKLIGAIDLAYISAKMLDLMGIMKLLDYLWIPNMFSVEQMERSYIYQDVIPLAKCLQKPIIGTVPLERCSDFKRFENHDFLWKIDAMFIEKSSWCRKYPLIVKKLLPMRDFRLGVVENCMTLKNVLESYQSIVNFIIRTISSIECQAIVLHSKCETAAAALGRVEIYCPVYVVLPLEDERDDRADQQMLNCQINLARSFNLRRNLQSIAYCKELNECNYPPIEFGIDYTRKAGLLETGDFIITLEVCKEDEDNVQYGAGDDVVILRAFYLPPPKTCEKFKYS